MLSFHLAGFIEQTRANGTTGTTAAMSQATSPTDAGHPPAALRGSNLASTQDAVRRESRTSESSDDGVWMSPAAARRFARRGLRRQSPTPDLVTSLVRPPSPDPFYIAGQVHSRARQDARPALRRGLSQALPGRAGIVMTGQRIGSRPSPHPSSLDIPARYGGEFVFDMYALTYVTDPDPNLLCPICHDPLVDPVTTPCDHTFCYRCLRRSIASSPSGSACPIDRDPLCWSNCGTAARLIRTQLNGLMVKCPYTNRGCDKEMRRETIEKHATTECRFRDYSCPGENCDKRSRHKPMDDECKHYQSQCKYCKEDIEAADSEIHLLSCTKAKTRCESCWEMVTRSSMETHHELDCEGIEVGCTYQDLGCPVRVERGQLEDHLMMCSFHPDTASGAVIRSQRDAIQSFNDLGAQIQEMQSRQEAATRRMDELAIGGSRAGSSVGDAVLGDKRTMQDFDAGFEEVHQNLTHLEARQSMWTLNQVMPIREEVTELRNDINVIRMRVNWLLNRSREEGRLRAANSSAAATTLRRDSAEATPILPERRRSSSADADVPRL